MDIGTLKSYRTRFLNELENDCLPFWIRNGLDVVNGGLYTALTRDGSIYSHDKSVWLNGRALWLFSHLCFLYGERSEWKNAAERCRKFLDNYCIDPLDGRMYFMVTEDGRPLRKRRYFFSETFYIMGSAEYYRAFSNESALASARKYYDMVMGIYRDRGTDPSHPEPKYDPAVRAYKTFAESMILLNVAAVMQDCDMEYKAKYVNDAKMLMREIFELFYHAEVKAVLENVLPDGKMDRDSCQGRLVNPGHVMESVWFLLTQMQYSDDPDILEKIKNMYKWSLEIGWDKEYGGLFYFRDAFGYAPEAIEHDMKVWWTACEMTIASIRLYEITGDSYYWDWFVRIDNYCTKNFKDIEYGEWFGYLHRDNTPSEPICKGNMFKGAFHVPRMLIEVERCLARMEMNIKAGCHTLH